MPRRDDAPPLTRGVVLRSLVFAVAVALGAVAVWLIVTGTDTKTTRLGILAGLWGLLLGTFALIGTRRGYSQRDDAHPDEPPPPVVTPASAAVEVRSDGVLERQRDAEERQAWREKLEAMIRQEVQEAVGREVSSLRAEIASLRSDLLEKVGGQLRLERIETTRVIGSDLEALQLEVRQLKNSRDPADLAALLGLDAEATSQGPAPGVTRRVVEAAQVRPVSRQTQELAVDVPPAGWSVQEAQPDRAAERPPAALFTAEPRNAPPPFPPPSAAPPQVAQPPAGELQETQPSAAQPTAQPQPAQPQPAQPQAAQPSVVPPSGVPPQAVPPTAQPTGAGPVVAEQVSAEQAARRSRHGDPEDALSRRAAHAAPSGPPRHYFAADDTGPIWARSPRQPADAGPEQSAPVEPPPPADAGPERSAPVQPPPPADVGPADSHWAFEDGLDSLPRLTPFTDVDPDPAPSDASAGKAAVGHSANGAHSDPDDYRGRRRRREDDEGQAARRARHADQSSGRRRRPDDEDEDGLLAQLLGRETAR